MLARRRVRRAPLAVFPGVIPVPAVVILPGGLVRVLSGLGPGLRGVRLGPGGLRVGLPGGVFEGSGLGFGPCGLVLVCQAGVLADGGRLAGRGGSGLWQHDGLSAAIGSGLPGPG